MAVPMLDPKPFAMPKEPVLRLLYCSSCGGSIDEIPPFEGRPEDDVALERLLQDHHEHPVLGRHTGLLFTVPVSAWVNDNARKQVIKQIREGLSDGLDEVDEKYYQTRNQMRSDAMECYGQHARPKDSCDDYMSERKRILPDTKAERKDLGLPTPKQSGAGVWLCQACPLHSVIMTKKRAKLGMYE